MISVSDIKTVVLVNAPFDKGNLYMNGIRFAEDATKFTITFDGNVVPYIPYTEFKWKHKRWKGKQNPNEKWIRRNTVNDLTHLINSASARESKLIMSRHVRTSQARQTIVNNKLEQMKSQGTVQSIKGNEMR